jgi:gamma-glutamylcyclotransferase (GGCT)/AIG2-like uncharacterized protein YtfP
MPHLFFYGTLMHPEVLGRVVRGRYRCEPAVLRGFARYRVRGQTYPAMIEEEGGIVEGVVRLDVSEDDVQRLDRFEGASYARALVHPTRLSGDRVCCETFLLRKERESVIDSEEWSLSWFREHGLGEFMAGYHGWSEVG